jgi:uncharacterized membrane protein YkvA (DUF1232 family)
MESSELEKHYSEEGFWTKIRYCALAVGKEGIRNALLMYCALMRPSSEVPAWAKAIIVGALGYFIFPLDAIPDMLPAVGYTDDLGVLAAALAAVRLNIPETCHDFAEDKMKEWFV